MRINLANYRRARLLAWLMVVAMLAMPLGILAQGTKIELPKNKYSVSDDVQAGREAVVEVERQLPIMNDRDITNYINRVGQRLVNAIPSEYRHPEFRYSFKVVNARDINAFALPGGPMYVNRGMIEAAKSEGEMAGVMAHEISHIALRHATAQATETQKYQIGSVLGQIAGAVIGGGIGSVISGASQIGFGIGALKYSRKYETQADILGAQIMSRAGYDPRDLANMFRTIERQSGGASGPEWMSSHPNPGNRYERINQEAQLIGTVRNPVQDTREFREVQAELKGMRRAPSMEEIARSGQQYPQDNRQPDYDPRDGRDGRDGRTDGRLGTRVNRPSGRYVSYTEGNLFRISVPENWRQMPSNNTVTYAPEGAYGTLNNGSFVFTHGVQAGVANSQGNDLRQTTDDFVRAILQGNPYLRQQRGYQRTSLDGHNALATTLSGRSDLTGQTEMVTIVTTQLSNGTLFYLIAVTPQNEYRYYQNTFSNILRSVKLND